MNLSKQKAQEWRDRRKAEGMCCTCSGKRPPEGKRQCLDCAEKRRQRERARYSSGLCGCGRPRDGKKAKCVRCGKRAAEWRIDNKRRYLDGVARSNAKKRLIVLAHYGNKCACCGETGTPFLTLDHINNDGNVQRANVPGARNVWRYALRNKFPTNLQILCWNCNLAKHHFGKGICPHKLRSRE